MKLNSKKSVFGVAASRIQANRIVDHLANAGFDRDHISVLFPDGGDHGGGMATDNAPAPDRKRTAVQIGLAVGGALAWLAGWNALSIPGFGHVIAGGPIGAVLKGATASTTATPGIKATLVGMGIRNNDARLYQSRVGDGQILISLQTDQWREANAARRIFQAMGATNITISGEKASGMLTRAYSRLSGRGRNSNLAPESPA